MAEEADLLSGSRPKSRPMSRTTSSNIVPAVPVVPVTPTKPVTAAKTKKEKQATKHTEVADAVPAASSKAVPATPIKSPTKASGKAQVVTKTPDEVEEVANQTTDTKEKKITPETPAKSAAKNKAASKKTEKVEKPATPAVDDTQKSPAKEVADIPAATGIANAPTKRQPPGKLDIPASKIVEKVPMPTTVPLKAEPQPKNVRTNPPSTTPSVPASPAVAAAPSPIKHTAAPRTLRLVSTPKVETPPAVAAPTPPLPQIPTVDKLRSRQASVASLNQPGTPASELVSDTASMTSGMISRASSPPPVSSIVGSAPVRKITKAQAKKNRQERKRQEEEREKEEAAVDKSDVEVVQAPIIGRKKKAKKPSTTPKPVAAMASAIAAAKSQPASPKSATVEDEPLNTPTVASVKEQSAHNSASATPEPEVHPEEASHRRDPSAQSILNDLQKTGNLLVSALEFFKPLSSTLTHNSRTSQSGHPTSPPDLKIHFSEADLDALARKNPVRLESPDGKPDSRTLITPNGKFFWGLTSDLEERALNLESQIDQLTGYLRYHPSSRTQHTSLHSPTSDVLPAIATALKEAGKKPYLKSPSHLHFDQSGTGYAQHLPPAEFPPQPAPPVQQQTPADAGAYLNQFVLPSTDNPPPNHPRPEMAAVGGAPGSGTRSISALPGAFEKAARAVVEGGAVGSTSLNDLASLARDSNGGVYVRGLEGLVGAGLGMGDENIRSALENIGVNGRDRSLFSLEEAEGAMLKARREQEVLERKLGGLVKRNRKVALGNVR